MTASPRVTAGVTACVKWVDLRPEVDALTGTVHHDARSFGISPADESAVALVLEIAEQWDVSSTVVCVGPPAADAMLRELSARRVDEVVRVDAPADADSAWVAAELGHLIEAGSGGAGANGSLVVVCGDHSIDRGSGSVPAFLAHQLAAAQALGLSEIISIGPERIEALRRLGGGRKEHVSIPTPAVISVESGVSRLARASLGAVLAASSSAVRVVPPTDPVLLEPAGVVGPYRPRPRQLPAPAQRSAFARVLDLTGALVERTPPQVLHLDPPEAADAIIDALRSWNSLG